MKHGKYEIDSLKTTLCAMYWRFISENTGLFYSIGICGASVEIVTIVECVFVKVRSHGCSFIFRGKIWKSCFNIMKFFIYWVPKENEILCGIQKLFSLFSMRIKKINSLIFFSGFQTVLWLKVLIVFVAVNSNSLRF